MNRTEKSMVRLVAKVAPWLAPFPSAYFVARSGMTHLALPLPVAIVVAAIIETLGLSTVHSALWLADWNASKRKTDPQAPVLVAVVLGAVYLVATLGLVVFLEVWPALSTYAPALFPTLAVVGGVNLALISQQERREEAVKGEKAERKAARQAGRQAETKPSQPAPQEQHPPASSLTLKPAGFDDPTVKARQAQTLNRRTRLDALLTFYADNPDAGPTDAGHAVGVSRQTIYAYLDELEASGRIARNNGTVQVLAASKG